MPSLLDFLPVQLTKERWAEFPGPHSTYLLVVYSVHHSSVYMCPPNLPLQSCCSLVVMTLGGGLGGGWSHRQPLVWESPWERCLCSKIPPIQEMALALPQRGYGHGQLESAWHRWLLCRTHPRRVVWFHFCLLLIPAQPLPFDGKASIYL